jgi:hypothetical protein
MLKIYSVGEGCLNLTVESCAESLDQPVDHLHFTLHCAIGTYKEHMEGVVLCTAGDDANVILAKCVQVYAEETLNILKAELANGLVSLQ